MDKSCILFANMVTLRTPVGPVDPKVTYSPHMYCTLPNWCMYSTLLMDNESPISKVAYSRHTYCTLLNWWMYPTLLVDNGELGRLVDKWIMWIGTVGLWKSPTALYVR